jgi:hypothetical protein
MQLFLHRADDCAPGSRSSLPFAIRKTARIIGHSELLQYMTRSVQIELLLVDGFFRQVSTKISWTICPIAVRPFVYVVKAAQSARPKTVKGES